VGCNSLKSTKSVHEKNKSGETSLTIVQLGDSISVSPDMNEVELKSAPFQLVFNTKGTNQVFVNAALEPTSYNKVINGKQSELSCFFSAQTFSEYAKNKDLEILVVDTTNDGYHCMFGHSIDEQFIRFDQGHKLKEKRWIGVRTVNTLNVLRKKEVKMEHASGTIFYLVYSPGQEKDGEAIKVTVR